MLLLKLFHQVRKFKPLNLSGRSLRQFIHHFDDLGGFEFAQQFQTVVQQVLFRHAGTGLQGDAGHDFLAIGIIGDPYRGCIENGRMLIKGLINFLGRNIFATLDNEFLDPAVTKTNPSSSMYPRSPV